jgi:threonine/homoserine/homoserine lactone efflux protein
MDLTHTLVAYAIPAALITMLPGPDTAMVLATAVTAGRRAAVRAAFGVGTGLLIWGAAAAAGLAAVLRSSALLFDAFRLACAAYLLLLGVQALLASRRQEPDPPPAVAPATRGRGRLPSFGWGYRRALMTCVLNPKLGVFFVVFLPQFVPTGAAVGPTSLALASLQAAEAVLWYLLLGGLAGVAGRALARRRVRAWLHRATATVFLGFGLRLAAETRW